MANRRRASLALKPPNPLAAASAVVSKGSKAVRPASTRPTSARPTSARPTPARPTSARPTKAPTIKSIPKRAESVKPIARTAKVIPVDKRAPEKLNGAMNGKPTLVTRPPKLATPSDKVAAKPSAKSAPVVAAAPAARSSAPIDKAPARPMLMQGPIAVRPLTKKGTFAPVKPPLNGIPPAKIALKRAKRRADRIEPNFVVVAPPTPAVRTSDKAQKNKAGLVQKELDFFRDLLLAKRRELVGDMSSMEREALRENGSDLSNLPVHMADQGTDAYEQEFTLGLVEKDRGLLRELNDAMAKIQNGTYGICEGTGNPISKARLEAQPWARFSIEYARQMEKRQMPFRR